MEIFGIFISGKIFNSFGLMLDLIGAILLFRFGFKELTEGEEYKKSLTWDAAEIKIDNSGYDNRKKYSKLGMKLIIFGFLLQIISNYI